MNQPVCNICKRNRNESEIEKVEIRQKFQHTLDAEWCTDCRKKVQAFVELLTPYHSEMELWKQRIEEQNKELATSLAEATSKLNELVREDKKKSGERDQ